MKPYSSEFSAFRNAGPMGESLLLEHTEPVSDFTFESDQACLCASGRAFGQCCGSQAASRPAPHGVFVVENYLDANTAREWIDYAEQCSSERLKVIDQKASTADRIVKTEDSSRVAERVELGPCRDELSELVANAFTDLAGRFAGRELEWYESPELMRYQPGGFYVRHADSQNFNPNTNRWTKVIDRDLSLLIYLNDDFEGGSLLFNRFNYRLRPKAGMAVLFPSDSRYLHTAETVTAGVRYAVVSWAAVRGIPRIAAKPPEPAVMLPRQKIAS